MIKTLKIDGKVEAAKKSIMNIKKFLPMVLINIII
jgi:hypothetical protein